MVLTDIVQIDRIAYDFIGGCGGQLINVDMADYDKIRADAVRLKAVKVEIRNRLELKSLGEEIGSLLEDGISGIIVSVHCARQSKLKVKDMDLTVSGQDFGMECSMDVSVRLALVDRFLERAEKTGGCSVELLDASNIDG